jgi:hypothetical protein
MSAASPDFQGKFPVSFVPVGVLSLDNAGLPSITPSRGNDDAFLSADEASLSIVIRDGPVLKHYLLLSFYGNISWSLFHPQEIL